MNKNNTLNILNGQVMYDYFKKQHLDEGELYIPFNEAICVGKVTADIFSSEFNKSRCDAHKVTMEEYKQITLKPLKLLFTKRSSKIVLWFDDDMFCQINFLTLLAYLDQINYSKNVRFNLINRKFEVIDSFKVSVEKFSEIYKEVMINRKFPKNISLPVMENGIMLYFQYLKEKNEITEYINQNGNLQTYILVEKLINEFPQYGLGDTQYLQMIENLKRL